MMKIVVFGASGRTGRLVVEQALAAGHEVTAVVRDPGKLAIADEALRVVQGAADQPDTIGAAVLGAQAVISAVGSGKGTLTALAQNLVPAMSAAGVHRLVSLVGAGVSTPGDQHSLGRTVMLGLMHLVARDVLADAVQHAKDVEASSLDWTLVRPPRLTDGPATGRITHAAHMVLGPASSITRADLAAFMIELAVTGRYSREAPMVANST